MKKSKQHPLDKVTMAYFPRELLREQIIDPETAKPIQFKKDKMKKKNVTCKELLKRCYKALLYSRDYVELVGDREELSQFDRDIGKILKGKKTSGEEDIKVVMDWVKTLKEKK